MTCIQQKAVSIKSGTATPALATCTRTRHSNCGPELTCHHHLALVSKICVANLPNIASEHTYIKRPACLVIFCFKTSNTLKRPMSVHRAAFLALISYYLAAPQLIRVVPDESPAKANMLPDSHRIRQRFPSYSIAPSIKAVRATISRISPTGRGNISNCDHHPAGF